MWVATILLVAQGSRMSYQTRPTQAPHGGAAMTAGAPPPAAGRRWSLRAHLLGLVLAVLLPIFAIAAVGTWQLAATYRGAYEARLTDTVRALALGVDGEIEAMEVAATAIATSPVLRGGDLDALRPWAEEVATHLRARVVINEASPGHRQLLNTAIPAGRPLPPPAPEPAPGSGAGALIERAVATRRPAVSDVFAARSDGRPTVAVAVAAPDGGTVAVVGVPTERLAALLAAQTPAGGGIVAIVDGQNRIVARSRDHDLYAGRDVPGRDIAGSPDSTGLFLGRTGDGEEAIYAFRRLHRAPAWSVVVAEPYAAYRASWMNPVLGQLAGAGSALVLAFGLALALARRIGGPVSALLRRAEGIAAGAPLTPAEPLPAAAVAEFEALRIAVERADAALRQGEAEFRAAFEQAAVPMSQVDCATGRLLRANPAYCELLGRREEEVVGRLFSDFVHPDDRAEDLDGFRRMASGQAPIHQVEKRYLRPDGSVRRAWLVSSVVRNAAGLPVRSLAIVQDVTERREAEERQRLLAREVDHRAKNALAVVQGALRLTPRDNADAYAQAVEGRVAALARAHTLLAECRWAGADLRTLLEGELQPFLVARRGDQAGTEAPRVELSGPPVRLGAAAAQPFSMVLHELATNAVKHGALSVAAGVVGLSWVLDRPAGVLRVRWTESGGPPITVPPRRRGFGSRVIELTVRAQLGGHVERRWAETGLVCEMAVPLERLAGGS
jgi:PAS domain S-box-containing protein